MAGSAGHRVAGSGTGRVDGLRAFLSYAHLDKQVTTADGRRIASASWDATVRLWPGPAAWPDLLCDKLNANMSHKQWREWVSPDVGYIAVCRGLPVAPD
jgi:hypothetical protein